MNVRIADFAAIISRTFLCKFSSFSDHFPLADTLLQKAPQPDFGASDCITKFCSFYVVIFHCLILNFPPTKEVPVLTNCLILSLPDMNRVSIVIVFVFVVKTLGRTAWTVEDIRPMNFVNSKTVV